MGTRPTNRKGILDKRFAARLTLLGDGDLCLGIERIGSNRE